jgi:arylsulfatase A-like enzyme/Tfp pilus assembly protein PilF
VTTVRPQKFTLALLLLVAVAIPAGWYGWASYQRSTRIGGVRNVVLISIDTCRADRLSCYGYKRQTTPHIDAVAKDGVLFRQALSPVPFTRPAHSTMLTGTYPPTHGVRLNNTEILPGDNVTLAEILREAGYQTAAFVSGFPLDAKFGVNQGFDTYDCNFTRKMAGSAEPAERTAEDVSRPALAWLEQHAASPFFLFLHYYDPHLPYEAPPPYGSDYPDDRYAGEIAYVDSWIGQVVDRLRALGAYDNTLLIITSDHGESLGEHHETSHGFFVYQSTQHIPLVVHAPNGRKGRSVEGRVSLVDLFSTVLDLTGLKTSAQLQGVSLRNDLEGRPTPDPRRTLYCESLHPSQFECSPLNGVVEGAWKYIRAPRQELYDLTKDPGENENVVETKPQIAERLRERLEEILPQMEAAAPEREGSAADPDAASRLRSLGYIGGDTTPNSTFDPALEDPKDFLPTYERLELANANSHTNRIAEAEKDLKDILSKRPGLIPAHRMLAEIANQAHRPADAAVHYGKIVEILTKASSPTKPVPEFRGDLPTAHFSLAYALRELGKDREAIAHYEKALALRPDYVEALNSLGLTLVHAGRIDDAIARYEQALKIKPDYVQAHNNLANVLERTGRHAQAIEHYEQALRIQPDFMDAHFNLALALEQSGQLAEAIGHYEQAAKLKPDSINALDRLAMAYADARRFDDAVSTAETALDLARSTDQPTLAGEIEVRLALYRNHQPLPAATDR